MKIFGLLRVFDKISEKNLVTIDQKKCSRFLNKHSTCSICMDKCPTGAIKPGVDDHVITVDGFLCNGCGTCINTCPNPVFSLEDVAFESIIKKITGKEQIIISCPRNSGNVQVPCLGYLNESLLLYIASCFGAFELNISSCKECESRAAIDLTKVYADNANSILNSLGKDKMIWLKEQGPSNDTGNESFTRKLISHFSDKNQGSSDSRQIYFKKAMENFGPIERRSVDAAMVPFGTLGVQPSCSGCGICAAMCPVGALLVYDEEVFKLEFNTSRCTGCGLCCQICPNNSIIMETRLELSEIMKGESRTVIQVEKAQCESCGEYFVKIHDHPVCTSCQKNQEIEDTFFN